MHKWLPCAPMHPPLTFSICTLSHSHSSSLGPSHVTRMLPATPTSLPSQTAPNKFFLLILPLVFLLLILLPSVSPAGIPAGSPFVNVAAGHFFSTNQVFPPMTSSPLYFHSSPLYFHPHIRSEYPGFSSRLAPLIPGHLVTKSQEEEMPRPSHIANTLPSLLYAEPDSANWVISGQQENPRTFNYFQPGNRLLLSNWHLAARGQRKPSCAARLKSSARFSTYGNAHFQVTFHFHCSGVNFFFIPTVRVNFFFSFAGHPGWVCDLQHLSQCKMPCLLISMHHHKCHHNHHHHRTKAWN